MKTMTQPNHKENHVETEEQSENENAPETAAELTAEEAVTTEEGGPELVLEDNDAGLAMIADLQVQLAEANEKTLRARADTENLRRRSERERQDMAKFAVSSFARDLLGVSDNLRRALEAITPEQREETSALENIFTGVEATERELLRVFENSGIKKIEPLDVPFDPNFHEVMFEGEVPGKEPGMIIQLLEAGYTIHDRLLRPARVGVAKGAADGGSRVNEEV